MEQQRCQRKQWWKLAACIHCWNKPTATRLEVHNRLKRPTHEILPEKSSQQGIIYQLGFFGHAIYTPIHIEHFFGFEEAEATNCKESSYMDTKPCKHLQQQTPSPSCLPPSSKFPLKSLIVTYIMEVFFSNARANAWAGTWEVSPCKHLPAYLPSRKQCCILHNDKIQLGKQTLAKEDLWDAFSSQVPTCAASGKIEKREDCVE